MWSLECFRNFDWSHFPLSSCWEHCAYSVWVCAHAAGFRYCIIIWVEHSYLMMSASWGKFIGVNFMVAFWELECSQAWFPLSLSHSALPRASIMFLPPSPSLLLSPSLLVFLTLPPDTLPLLLGSLTLLPKSLLALSPGLVTLSSTFCQLLPHHFLEVLITLQNKVCGTWSLHMRPD